MPCKPAKARHLLREGKADVITICPFTIRLNWNCESNTQEIVVGLDTGAMVIGCGVTNENNVIYQSETRLRTDINKKMLRRRAYRRNRRYRKTRYRQPRFDNRKRPKGWLPPSLRSKADSTIKIVKKLSERLPISKIRVEIAKFDTQKLQNPDINGKEYQQGQMEDYDNVRAYVFERDKYTCGICKKRGGILEVHHIIHRKDGGSDRPGNLVTVHEDCHEKFHRGEIKHTFRKPKHYKMEAHVTILKDVIVDELRKCFDVSVETTFGYITKTNRKRLGLEKTHYNDAIAIAVGNRYDSVKQPDRMYLGICRPRGNYKLYKGSNSQTRNQCAKELFGFKRFDILKYNKDRYILKGKRSSGYFCIADENNKTIHPSIHYSKLKLLNRNNIMEVNVPIPPTTEAVGILGT